MQTRNLPALSLLTTFEIAARHLSFTEAAAELCITQGAVSRQIRALEMQIGVPLFNRLHRALSLTAEGARLLETVESNLSELTACVTEIRSSSAIPQLTVGASVSFAYFWLMPRLEKFNNAFPDIDLRVLATDQTLDPSRDTADIAILYGDGKWPGLQANRLFGERVYPVCSPAYLRARPDFSQPASLTDQTLLHLDGGGGIWGSVDWPVWLRAHQISGQPGRRGIRMNNYPMLIKAAMADRGVALGWSYIVDEMILEGVLVKPIDLTLETQNGYYLVASRNSDQNASVKAFRGWILEEIEAE